MIRITVLGLGEAGRRYASGLAAQGAVVTGYDPYADECPPGVSRATELAPALADAELVLSLTGASAALSVAQSAAPLLKPGTVYADLNTASVAAKRELAAALESHGVALADVAVLAPVPRDGHASPLAASGSGAEAFHRMVTPLGVPVEVVGREAGDAARLKLLRSVFMKGLAALVIEGLAGAEAVGAAPWLRAQMVTELDRANEAMVERLITGSHTHAERRRHEVEAALEALEETGEHAEMTRATLAWFDRLSEAPQGAAPQGAST